MMYRVATRRRAAFLALLGIVPIARPSVGRSEAPEAIVRRYLAAQEATMQRSSGEAELQRVASLFSDSVVYEHPRAGARVNGAAEHS
jgi:hypothetical protein